ncbi:MAG: hypothetical protein ABIJ40_12835 [Bacteroidota bacterium]
MYKRHDGDDLFSEDKRLKYKWTWCRVASQIDEKEIKKWTHFQVSECIIERWRLKAIQWGGDFIRYEAEITYGGEHITSIGDDKKNVFKTRIEAQIAAEKLLKCWIKEEYKRIINKK